VFCPLCKSEYRDGFTECSDCHILLLATEAEASAVPVEQIWKGDDRNRSNEILDALTGAAIPVHSGEKLNKRVWPWVAMAIGTLTNQGSELEICVLGADSSRAIAIIQEIKRKADLDYDDEGGSGATS
jgi:hypothetical protein